MISLFNVKNCYFCTNNIKRIDYKDVDLLRKFLDSHARLPAHRRTGVCARHQRALALAVKRARRLAFLPFVES